jgi:hypothetical protein
MKSSFYKFPQTRFWYEIQEHLSALPGVAVTHAADDAVIGSWIDFTVRGHSFTINSQSGEFMFFAMTTDCPERLLAEIASHFEAFRAEGIDFDGGGDISLRGV